MARKDDLSKPRGTAGGPSYDPDAFGRFAEGMARYLGTGRYLAIQSGIVVIWILLNLVAVSLRWDPYPFILLNLVFSTQAAYAAPLILLAQNRQADRDRVEIERDRDTNARSLAESEFLAREIAALRISIERKADREDLLDAMHEITQALGRLTGDLDTPNQDPGDVEAITVQTGGVEHADLNESTHLDTPRGASDAGDLTGDL
ncbi:MAG TPA: DUF1003 domain-containing protein [Solirubrobacteraceae bacterium]|jgi:uncharacterized membrane protein|nr:DUF1003 domain-containing protein [Solirubrobacteraceae bacterium]